MTVCIVINSLFVGGSERKIVKVSNYFSKCGKRVTLVCLNKEHSKYLLDLLCCEIDVVFLKNKREYLSFALRNKFDNIFLLNSFPALLASLFRIANLDSNIVFLNNTSILPENFSRIKLLNLLHLNRHH